MVKAGRKPEFIVIAGPNESGKIQLPKSFFIMNGRTALCISIPIKWQTKNLVIGTLSLKSTPLSLPI